VSGGSWDYVYRHVEDAAERMETEARATMRPGSRPTLRAEFAAHLRLVAAALHDVEWVDSCDYGPGDDVDAIRACLSSLGPRTKRKP
jgi:hypothetical protein